MAVNSAPKAARLRPNCLSFPEVLAQSVSLIAPTITAALNAPLVFASAGNGTWLAYVIATIGLVLVSLNINHFAKRSALSGALYIYTAKGLGATAGIICGWALTLAYLLVAATVTVGFAHYSDVVLQTFGFQVPSILLYAICLGIAWYYAYTDIQVSTMLMLVLELLAISVIVVLAVVVLGKQGFPVDAPQITLEGVTPSGISLGMVIAILSYVGFESATTLGDEAKSPTRYIPLAIVWSTILTGLFFIFISYTEVLGFRGSEIPLNQMIYPCLLAQTLLEPFWM
jgi:amino acid transporter